MTKDSQSPYYGRSREIGLYLQGNDQALKTVSNLYYKQLF